MSVLFLIIHQESGYGRGSKIWKKVKKELEKRKVSFRSFYTEYPGHAEALARQIATIQDYRLKTVIGIGGEGTINEIVNGLSSFDKIQMGFIYSGSRNKSLTNFSLSSDPKKAIKHLFQRWNAPLNGYYLGEYRVEGKSGKNYFFNRVGIGLDASILSQEKKEGKAKSGLPILGHVRFIVGLLKVLWNYEFFSISLETDQEQPLAFDSVWFIIVSNRSNRDGNLHVLIIKEAKRLKLLPLLLLTKERNKTKNEFIEEISCKEITVKTDSTRLVHADGDVIGESPVIIKISESHKAFIL
ncbi:diacylglycerol/lipid kinase family protein [Metabacillus litoralis]|uniref:diacylglycerol/lipid kinase family protein n=1 Tax=Metabacillus litoralis TaxID=152268 RepID=UPI000EF5CA99|nr:YegS/Rv2252/BmrU family lipid kinase [Metabacillus litoralis]